MICGVDEAGRGPALGPMVIACVKVEDENILKKIGVRDSKKCSPKSREKIAFEIKKIANVLLKKLEPKEIDELRKKYTMNEIEVKEIAKILIRAQPFEIAYIDAVDVDEERFGKSIADEIPYPIKIISKHKADVLFPIVSAASIIAKVERDKEIEKIKKITKMNIGSGYPSDPITISFLKNWLAEKKSLPDFARASWETCKRLLEVKKYGRIDR
ncbi:MAG: ribonuclease HII [Candidatus Thermoplasmatota archaeon]